MLRLSTSTATTTLQHQADNCQDLNIELNEYPYKRGHCDLTGLFYCLNQTISLSLHSAFASRHVIGAENPIVTYFYHFYLLQHICHI